MARKYIIYAPDFDENSGGIVVLHYLCHLLNIYGCDAGMIRLRPRLVQRKRILFVKYLRYWVKIVLKIPLKTNSLFCTPMAKMHDVENAIVVYPDIVCGNPLNANHIVRWYLHKPGFWLGEGVCSTDGLLFYYSDQFNVMGLHSDRRLKIVYLRDDVYVNLGKKDRSGSCYILRKGRGRRIVHDLTESVLIDGMSHEEAAETFNRVKYCISYDKYTMYNRFAAMCGCIVIVIPEDGLTKEEWMPKEEDRYGIAYGFEDERHAIETYGLMQDWLTVLNEEIEDSVKRFISITQSSFA